MDFELTREDMMIKNAIHDWVSKECARDVISELDEKGEFPKKLLKKLATLGFFGMTIPEEHGGEGRNILGACIVAEELASIFPALSECYAGSAFYGGAVISELGSDDQKKKYLPGCAKGKIITALAMTEADDDPDAEQIETEAVIHNDSYFITGKKRFVSLADKAGLLIVLAKTGGQEDGKDLTLFCLDSKADGVTITSVEKIGLKGANVCDIKLDNVEITGDAILGGADQLGEGRDQLKKIQDIALLYLASSAVGLGQGAFDYALKHARERVQFGQIIGKFPAISHKFSETAIKVDASRLLAYRAASLADKGKSYSREVFMAKCLACETAVNAAMEGLQVMGGYGYTMEYDIQRYVRDAMGLLSSGITADELKGRIGASLGLG